MSFHRKNVPYAQILIVLSVLLAVVVFVSTWARSSAQWTHYTHGPLTCVAYGAQMQCTARQITLVPMPPAPQQQSITPTSDHAAVGCIALAVFTEARGESWFGRAAVAKTVVNRATGSALSPCTVVTQRSQYQGIEQLQDDPERIDAEAWASALVVAQAVLEGEYDLGACADAVSFHALGNELPDWAQGKREVCRIGRHRFYGDG